MAGKLNKYSEEVRNRFLASKTEEDVTSIMKDFVAAVEAGKEKDAGFPSAGYAVSKAGLIGGTRALARQEKEKGSKVLINTCCPGYVNTDMTKGRQTFPRVHHVRHVLTLYTKSRQRNEDCRRRRSNTRNARDPRHPEQDRCFLAVREGDRLGWVEVQRNKIKCILPDWSRWWSHSCL